MKTSKHRLILPMHAKGNVGKSIETAARACWLNQRGIHWQGFDLDGDNKTLSRLFPTQAKLVPLNGQPGSRSENENVRRQRTRTRASEPSRRKHHAAVLSEFVKLRLAKLEADHQRGIPFNEAIGNGELGLDVMARGVMQDWLGNLFAQYDRIAAKLLPAAEAAGIKPKIAPPIGELATARRGAKVNLIG